MENFRTIYILFLSICLLMSSQGSLLVLFAIGLFVFVGLFALSSLHGDVVTSNVTDSINAANSAVPIINGLFTVLGILAVLVGAYALINAYSSM